MPALATRLLRAGLAAALLAGCGAFDSDVVEPAGGADAVAVTVRPLDGSPVAGVADAAVGWTGAEYVVVGGVAGNEKFGADGEPETADDGPLGAAGASAVAYDPAVDSWRSLPDSPLAPRSRATVAWTGTELLVWGGAPDRNGVGGLLDAAAYDPITDTWRQLPSSPDGTSRSFAQAVVVDDRIVIGGGAARDAGVDGDLLLFDLASERWRAIPGRGRVTHLLVDDATVLVARHVAGDADSGEQRRWVVERFDPRSGSTDVVGEVVDDAEGEEFARGSGLFAAAGEVHLGVRYANGPTRLVRVVDADGGSDGGTTDAGPVLTVGLGVPGDEDGFGRPPTFVLGDTTLAVADARVAESLGLDPSVPTVRAVGVDGEQRCVNGLGWGAGPAGELLVVGGGCEPELLRASQAG